MDQREEGDSLPAETDIGRLALRVAAIEDMTDFYSDVIGLSVLERTGDRAVLGAGEEPLLILEHAPEAPARGRDATGLYHTAFRVPSRTALGDALGRIRDRWRLDGASDHGVSEALYCTDPEGNGVEVYRDYPREAWPWTDDGRVRMTNDPLASEGVAAAASGAGKVPAVTEVGHVHLEVSSLATVETVYADALGFDVMATLPGAVFLAAGGYHHQVGANTWHQRRREAGGRGLAWVELLLPEGGALAAARDRLVAGGYAVQDLEQGDALTEPDGIELRLVTAN